MNELRVGKGKRKKEWRGSVFPLFDRADSTHRRADARRHRGGAAACFFNFIFFPFWQDPIGLFQQYVQLPLVWYFDAKDQP